MTQIAIGLIISLPGTMLANGFVLMMVLDVVMG